MIRQGLPQALLKIFTTPDAPAATASEQEINGASALGPMLFIGAMTLVVLALLGNVELVQGAEVPIMVLPSNVFPTYGSVFAAVIFLGIYTTVTPLLWTVCRRFAVANSTRYRLLAVGLTLICWVGGAVSQTPKSPGNCGSLRGDCYRGKRFGRLERQGLAVSASNLPQAEAAPDERGRNIMMMRNVAGQPAGGPPAPTVNRRNTAVAAAASVALAAFLAGSFGWRQAALFLVGLGAGLVLYHAAFGFTSAWRAMITEYRSAGLRAQMVMLGVTVAVFIPLLDAGELWGTALRGSVAPLSSSIVVGAFLFGVGMQLGGGCASGTLFTAGGGSVRMMATLLAFIAGSVLGAWHWPVWQNAPQLGPVSLLQQFGTLGAMAISLTLFALVWAGAGALERRRHGTLAAAGGDTTAHRWLRGPWPLIAGAVGLAAINVATLSLAGRPWGVTSGFALWGSKTAALLGLDVATWPYWQRPGPAAALQTSVFGDITSVMNFGILLGALAAAGLAGRFAPNWRIPPRSLAAAVVGGLLLGYGARIAYGCNIGAFFSGLASASLHGWLWFAAAFAGNALGTRLRPAFGLQG